MDATNGDRVRVMLQCNDWRNGARTNYVTAIEIDDSDTFFLSGRPLVCRKVGRHIFKFGRMVIRPLGYHAWVGNWCWDMALVKMADAVRIINYCQRYGWDCESGETRLFDFYRSGQPVTAELLQDVLDLRLQGVT